MSLSLRNLQKARTLIKHAQLNLRNLNKGLTIGNYLSFFKSDGLEYIDSSIYSFGDDSRRINWNLTGKFSQLYTKYYREERNRNVLLVLDTSSSMQLGNPDTLLEKGGELGLFFLYWAYMNKDKVSALFFSDIHHKYFYPSNSTKSLHKISSHICDFYPKQTSCNFKKLESAILQILNRRSLVVVVSDFLNNEYQMFYSRLSKSHNLIFIRVSLLLEQFIAHNGHFKYQDPETHKHGAVYLSSMRNELIERQLFLNNQFRIFCHRNKIPYIECAHNQNATSALVGFFQTYAR